jgi:hypothetical protein
MPCPPRVRPCTVGGPIGGCWQQPPVSVIPPPPHLPSPRTPPPIAHRQPHLGASFCLSADFASLWRVCGPQSDSDDDGDDSPFNAESLYDSFKRHLHGDWDDGLFDDDESDGEEYIPKHTGRRANQK